VYPQPPPSFIPLADGGSIAYRCDDFTDTWTPSDAVVFLHGGAEGGEAWRAWVPWFARRYRLLRPDLRGFGASPAPSQPGWPLELFVEDVRQLIEAHGCGAVHIIAAKLGGTVAIRLAARYPELVRSLTLAGVPPSPKTALGPSMPEWKKHLAVSNENFVRATIANRFGTSMKLPALEWWVRFMASTDRATLLGLLEMVPEIDVSDDLAQIRCETLVLTTPGSGLGSVEEVSRWQRRIASASLVVVDGDSYHVAASHPDECARAVRAFLDRISGLEATLR